MANVQIMRRFSLPVFVVLGLLITVAGLTQCGDDSVSSGLGTLSIRITDAAFPYPFIQSVHLTISSLDIRSSAGSSFQTAVSRPKTFDLFSLQNGRTDTVGVASLPAGSYDTLRLHVPAISVGLTDGRTFLPEIADSTGIVVPMTPALSIRRGQTTELVIDFDLPRSLSAQGDMTTSTGITGFVFTPAVRAVDLATVGQITGSVKHDNRTPSVLTDDVPIRGLLLSVVQVGATDTVSVLTNDAGEYTAFFVPAGTYAIMVSPTDSTADWSVSGVIVTTATPTRQDALTERH